MTLLIMNTSHGKKNTPLDQEMQPVTYVMLFTMNVLNPNSIKIYSRLFGTMMFVAKKTRGNFSLRDSVNKLVVPFPRTKYTKYSFSYSGATLWNSLLGNSRESGA